MKRKDIVEHAIAVTLLMIWVMAMPTLIMPLNVTVFGKVIVSTAGACAGFCIFMIYILLKMFQFN
jgi:hypothetical protein